MRVCTQVRKKNSYYQSHGPQTLPEDWHSSNSRNDVFVVQDQEDGQYKEKHNELVRQL